ncbi:MAG: hypothetical protein ABI653_06190 [Bacteroidota bacterium]
MKPKHIIKIFLFIFIAGYIFLLNSCSEIGTQPPIWKSGMFSPDGKYYVYSWTEFFVNQYSKRGNATFRSGSSTTYLQIIDCMNGRKLLDKPLKSPEMLTIADIANNHVWLVSYEISKRWAPALFDIDSLKMTYSASDLMNINPAIPMKMQVIGFYNNDSGKPGGVFEAADGRQYLIDPHSGKFLETTASRERIDTKDENCYQTTNNIKDIRMGEGTRKKLMKGNLESKDDFISPEFLALVKNADEMHATPTIYSNNFFVLSPAFTTDKKEMQLTCLDKDSFTTQWSIALPQNENEDHTYNKERFFLQGDKLLVANTSNICVIDLLKSSISATYPLFDVKEKSKN